MLKILVKKCGNMSLEKRFWKLYTFLNRCMVRQKPSNRQFTQENLLEYKPDTIEYSALRAAIKNISVDPTQIPICIGGDYFGTSDVHYQRMPHNTRCTISQMSTGNAKILDHYKRVADETHDEWRAIPMKERIGICTKCADLLATERRHALNASIMLGQSKTYRQAEEDTCRTINSLRNCAELLSKLEAEDSLISDPNGYVMRAKGGFIAAMTTYNWTSQAVNLVLGPALMGNCVVWVPSQLNVLSSYQIFQAFEKAGIPGGVISFIPMNRTYFLNKITTMPHLAGFNYAGRLPGYELLASVISKNMDRPNCFAFPSGPVENKNFHFIHESANVEQAATETVRAAFDYNGQRGDSCENVFVPSTLWCDFQEALMEKIAELHIGDVCDTETTISAVIDRPSFNRIAKMLKHAEISEDCEIVCGGNYNSSFGNFIEPTVVVCKSLQEQLMTKEIQGPILSVCIYESKEINEILKFLACSGPYTLAGSIFAGNEKIAQELASPLRTAAANIYINKACIGDMSGFSDEMPDLNHESIASQYSLLKHW